jgi:hypothetical protein
LQIGAWINVGTPTEKFVTNTKGRRVGVIVGVREYRKILRDLEELESIKAYDQAKASGDDFKPLEQALEEIEKTRR